MPRDIASSDFNAPNLVHHLGPSVCITGPIAVGKSELIRNITLWARRYSMPSLGEPHSIWLIAKYYKDPSIFSQLFQAACTTSLGFTTQLYMIAKLGFICERQAWDTLLFSEMLLDDKLVSPLFVARLRNIVATQLDQTDFTILLIAQPFTCFQRLRERNRTGEMKITLDFCRQLNLAYVEFYAKHFDQDRVFVIPAEGNRSSVKKTTVDALNHIRKLGVPRRQGGGVRRVLFYFPEPRLRPIQPRIDPHAKTSYPPRNRSRVSEDTSALIS